MEIRSGEMVALVGENGSGKTTLAKILAGLYLPDDGVITWDGVDISNCDPRRLRESVAVVFQDFVRYQLSAQENIGVGAHRWNDDLDRVVGAARQAGVDGALSSLEHGYETRLGPQFIGGSDLSVGQWQQVALARAFLRDAPFIILDEPSAALDPRAEHDLVRRIRSLCAGRSVLLVSHRLSNVRAADRIYVMKDGVIVERGTHTALMQEQGLYAELFSTQASAYLDSPA